MTERRDGGEGAEHIPMLLRSDPPSVPASPPGYLSPNPASPSGYLSPNPASPPGYPPGHLNHTTLKLSTLYIKSPASFVAGDLTQSIDNKQLRHTRRLKKISDRANLYESGLQSDVRETIVNFEQHYVDIDIVTIVRP